MIVLSDVFIGDFPLSQGWAARPSVYKKFGQAGHNGWDFVMPNGTLVVSPADGECLLVAEGRKNGELVGFGRYCKILHKQGSQYFVTVYAHLQSVETSKGQKVIKHQLLAKSDNNGFSSAPHLHFGVYLSDSAGNKAETNLFGGYHDPGDEKLITWKIENPKEPVSVVQSDSLDEAVREIASLKNQVAVYKQQLQDLAQKLGTGTDFADIVGGVKKITDLEDQLNQKQRDLDSTNAKTAQQAETLGKYTEDIKNFSGRVSGLELDAERAKVALDEAARKIAILQSSKVLDRYEKWELVFVAIRRLLGLGVSE